MKSLRIAVFSLNPAAAGGEPALESSCRLVRALARIGHHVTFYYPDLFDRRTLWGCTEPDGVNLVHYPTRGWVGLFECLEEAGHADVIVKMSDSGPFNEMLMQSVLEVRKDNGIAVLLDLEPQATLARLHENPNDPLLGLIAGYDLQLIVETGIPLLSACQILGARQCVRLWSTLNPGTRQMLPPDLRSGGRNQVTLEHVKALEQAFAQSLAARGQGSRVTVPAA